MAFVEKGNVLLRVEPEEVGRYLAKGFAETNGKGKVLRSNVHPEQAKIAALEEQIKALKAENKKLKDAKG